MFPPLVKDNESNSALPVSNLVPILQVLAKNLSSREVIIHPAGLSTANKEDLDSMLEILAPYIESLTLHGEGSYVNPTVAWIDRGPKLTRLSMHNQPFTNTLIEGVAGHCDKLEQLRFINCTSAELLFTGDIKWSRLTSLALTQNQNVTDARVDLIGLSCPQLRHADFSDCPTLTDMTLGIVGRSLPKLDSLNLSGCVQIALKRGVAGLINLKKLNLSRCENIRDEGLKFYGYVEHKVLELI